MTGDNKEYKDPVCNMIIDSDDMSVDYMGKHYIFCSDQCKSRFQDNPHLYIGYPGSKAPKQEGKEVLKQRTIKLVEPLSSDLTEITIAYIESMMGIKEIIIKGDQIRITYDLLQATEKQIEQEIENSGGVLGRDWANKLRRMFIEYTEEAEVLSMEAKPNTMRCHKH